jgi:hypothetical protein
MRDDATATNRTTLVLAERNPTGGAGGSTEVARDASPSTELVGDTGDVRSIST